MMIKSLNSIDHNNIINEYKTVESSLVWTEYGHKGKQCGLQFKDGEDPWTSAVGPSKGNELSYINLNPFFKNTIFEELIDSYKLYRTRLMWVGPYACYSMHKDTSPRIHIPLITNKDCLFVFRSKIPTHLSAGSVFWTDTRHSHSFMNCSDQPRLHLVGVVES
jgi:hypothetical protein